MAVLESIIADLKVSLEESKIDFENAQEVIENLKSELCINTSLAAPGVLANRLQRRTARKANKANLDPPNQKSEITSL